MFIMQSKWIVRPVSLRWRTGSVLDIICYERVGRDWLHWVFCKRFRIATDPPPPLLSAHPSPFPHPPFPQTVAAPHTALRFYLRGGFAASGGAVTIVTARRWPCLCWLAATRCFSSLTWIPQRWLVGQKALARLTRFFSRTWSAIGGPPRMRLGASGSVTALACRLCPHAAISVPECFAEGWLIYCMNGAVPMCEYFKGLV